MGFGLNRGFITQRTKVQAKAKAGVLHTYKNSAKIFLQLSV